jgi:hypothetical protein
MPLLTELIAYKLTLLYIGRSYGAASLPLRETLVLREIFSVFVTVRLSSGQVPSDLCVL